jgi:hypothetical protein
MYIYGSAFYAIYFIVSFPAYRRLSRAHSLLGSCFQKIFYIGITGFRFTHKSARGVGAARDGLAAAMMVFIILDWWRLSIGAITSVGAAHSVPFAQAPVAAAGA